MPAPPEPPQEDPQPGYSIEYPTLSTRYLMPPDNPVESEPLLATRFEASNEGLIIDGQAVPWHLYRVPIQVDDIGSGFRVVYLPVMIEGEVVAGAGVREASLGELLAGDPPPADDPEAPGAQAPVG